MQRFKRRKLLFSTALVFHVRLFYNQFTHKYPFKFGGQWPHFEWDLIIAWTWTNRVSIGTHVAYQLSVFLPHIKKVFHPSVDGSYYIFYDGWHDRCFFLARNVFKSLTPCKQGNLRIIDLGKTWMDSFHPRQYTFWTRQHWQIIYHIMVVQLEAPGRHRPYNKCTHFNLSVMQASCSVFEKPFIPWIPWLTRGGLKLFYWIIAPIFSLYHMHDLLE